MMRFVKSMQAWGTPGFSDVLKAEIEQLDVSQLPLQQGMSSSSYALEQPVNAMILGAAEQGDTLRVRVGIFYKGMVAGCSCADDPTPVDANDEYCEVQFEIDKLTGAATAVLVSD
jgi:hypothetical protein